MCTLQILRTVGSRADAALGCDLPRMGYTVCFRAASYNLLVCLCQLCVHINITLLWPQQQDGKAAEQGDKPMVTLTTPAISEPLEQHKPLCSSTYSSSSEPVLVQVPCQGSVTWAAAGLGCHRSWVTQIPRCDRRPASTGSHLTLLRCLSTQLCAQPQPFLTKHSLWGAALVSC